MGDQHLYDRDFFGWVSQQAGLLRAGRLADADIEHIADETESIGKTGKREEQRDEVDSCLVENPGLKSALGDAIVSAYLRIVIGAAWETDFARDVFPVVCPWSIEPMMERNFYPEATN